MPLTSVCQVVSRNNELGYAFPAPQEPLQAPYDDPRQPPPARAVPPEPGAHATPAELQIVSFTQTHWFALPASKDKWGNLIPSLVIPIVKTRPPSVSHLEPNPTS